MGGFVPVMAQSPLPWQSQPAAVAPQPQPGVQTITMYAIKSAHIRQAPDPHSPVIGKVAAGQPLQAVPLAGGRWYQLATGGFVSASLLRAQSGVVIQPSAPQYHVGDCQPYSGTAMVGGQPQQINGTACLQPDGSWHIVKTGSGEVLPAPVVVPAPQTVVVAPAPVVVGPPVVYYERPYYRHYY
jgi:hypothetical protein